MKSDLDRLMKEAGIDALVVTGPAAHNPAMMYLTGRSHITHGDLVKRWGESPLLFYMPMERDEAARTGLQTKDLSSYDWPALLKEAGDDTLRAMALRYRRILRELSIRGRVALYGTVDIGPYFGIFEHLREFLPEVEWVGEADRASVLTRARATKDEAEVDRIRQMGRTATAVLADIQGFLASHQAKNGFLVNRQGETLTIGEVKRRINLWLAMRGADNPEGAIFAIGHDAGVPHSTGDDKAPVEVGKTIVLDLFPCEAGGGYFYDITRTWCIGHATDEVLAVYEDVRNAYTEAVHSLKPDIPCREFQIKVCQWFESKGHPTVLNHPQTQEGYVHSLAHGVGLAVHEGPTFTHLGSNNDLLLAGSVVTIEPGLYYPERGFGVRLEDPVWMRPDGVPEVLAPYPMELVLKLSGS